MALPIHKLLGYSTTITSVEDDRHWGNIEQVTSHSDALARAELTCTCNIHSK